MGAGEAGQRAAWADTRWAGGRQDAAGVCGSDRPAPPVAAGCDSDTAVHTARSSPPRDRPPRGGLASPRAQGGTAGGCPRSSWTPDPRPGWAGGKQRPPLPATPAGLAPQNRCEGARDRAAVPDQRGRGSEQPGRALEDGPSVPLARGADPPTLSQGHTWGRGTAGSLLRSRHQRHCGSPLGGSPLASPALREASATATEVGAPPGTRPAPPSCRRPEHEPPQ